MEPSLIIKIAATFGLSLLTPACESKSVSHNYNYNCTNGTNKKNGESIRTDDGNRGWYRRQDTEAGDSTSSIGELPAGTLYRRGYRTFVVQRSGHTIFKGESGGQVK